MLWKFQRKRKRSEAGEARLEKEDEGEAGGTGFTRERGIRSLSLSASRSFFSRFSPVSRLISFKMASNLIYTASSHGSRNTTGKIFGYFPRCLVPLRRGRRKTLLALLRLTKV